MMGKSTFGLAMKLMKLCPVRIVDRLLLLYSKFTLGNTASYGLSRPVEGPLELKSKTGKTPVLDVGTVAKIRTGDIKVFPNIKGITATGVQFEDDHAEEYDVIILAIDYRSDVPRWLKKDSPVGSPTQSAHLDDKYSKHRTLLKKRFGLLPTQQPPPSY